MIDEVVEALLDRLPAGPLDPDEALRLGERLREEYPAEVVAVALTQHELRVAARARFRLADRMFFTRDGLEQASAEPVARHRAGRFASAAEIVDLCCGVGGDLIALAGGRPALAVDRDPVHLAMALRNAEVYGAREVRGRCADVRDVGLPAGAAVFVDPARRARGRRLPPGASEPPLAWCLGLADVAGPPSAVGVKAAPGLPLDLVPAAWEVEFVAVGPDLKEAVLWSPALATGARRATVLPRATAERRATVTVPPEGVSLVAGSCEPPPVAAPGTYLLDPNPAVTRAGLVGQLAGRVGAWKIDEQVAFLSVDHPVRTPFGRTLQVVADLPWNLKRLRAALRARDVGEVRRRLRLKGSGTVTVVLTRVAGRPWVFVCEPCVRMRDVYVAHPFGIENHSTGLRIEV